jgi:hypothetical protein
MNYTDFKINRFIKAFSKIHLPNTKIAMDQMIEFGESENISLFDA